MTSRNTIAILAGCGYLAGPVAAADPPSASAAQAAAVEAAEPAVHTSRPAAPPRVQPSERAAASAVDRLELDRTQITGNAELPKVMVVVPWKKADIGELVGRPLNSLVDEALQPVDRDVFRREIDYYRALSATRSPDETSVTAAPQHGQPEK
jgi:hypothetical protein